MAAIANCGHVFRLADAHVHVDQLVPHEDEVAFAAMAWGSTAVCIGGRGWHVCVCVTHEMKSIFCDCATTACVLAGGVACVCVTHEMKSISAFAAMASVLAGGVGRVSQV